jgi:hypothetical protein
VKAFQHLSHNLKVAGLNPAPETNVVSRTKGSTPHLRLDCQGAVHASLADNQKRLGTAQRRYFIETNNLASTVHANQRTTSFMN